KPHASPTSLWCLGDRADPQINSKRIAAGDIPLLRELHSYCKLGGASFRRRADDILKFLAVVVLELHAVQLQALVFGDPTEFADIIPDDIPIRGVNQRTPYVKHILVRAPGQRSIVKAIYGHSNLEHKSPPGVCRAYALISFATREEFLRYRLDI